LSDLKQKNESLEKELERAKELFKQLEFEKELKQAIEKAKELAEEQKKEAEKSKKDLEKQQELNKQFQDLKEDLKDLNQKNENLEKPNEFDQNSDLQEDIQQNMNNAEQQIQQQQIQKAGEQQQQSAEQLDQLAKELEQQQDEMEAKQTQEDMRAIRQLLDNLIKLSFDQEKLIDIYKKTPPNNPQYTQYIREQGNIKTQMQMVADSLYALSKRVVQLESFINKEVKEVQKNIESSISNLNERINSRALSDMQYSMTGINNLAVMLNESFEKMQQQMQQMQGKKGKANKPAPKPNGSMSEMQKKLNEQLKEMGEQMKNGKIPKPGDQGKNGSEGQQMSEQMARMAAQQKAIRNMLQKIDQEMNKSGGKPLGNLDQLMSEMEKIERDLYNKRLTEQTLLRQKEILTRLLEAEDAIRQQKQDVDRNAKKGNPYQEEFIKQLNLNQPKQKINSTQFLNSMPYNLNDYYKNKNKDYIQKLGNTPQP
jgi:myosin heavy subunit